MKDPEINPSRFCHLMPNEDPRNIPWRKDSFFNKCAWKN
jgi:hypothetical protein